MSLSRGWRRAQWQLLYIDSRGGEVVVDAVHLDGDDLDVGGMRSGELINVGFQAVDDRGASGLDDLHDRLQAWNADGGICDAYLLGGPNRCFVLVHDDEAVVIGTN